MKNLKKTQKNMQKCEICPRKCKVLRSETNGFCNETDKIRIAKIIEHFQWEEPCLAGPNGTLAIFFSGCNLACDYCQNHEISRGGVGKLYSPDEFADLINRLQETHDSIDLVTPTHFSAQLESAFSKIHKKVPVIWNTNSYETVENIKKVSNFVDIFLADLKYADDEIGQSFSKCNNYFSCALPGVKEMCAQKLDKFSGEQMMQGVILRHLVLPGHTQNSIKVLDIIKDNFSARKISIMSQFTPNGKSSLNRKLTPLEYKAVLRHMQTLGLENGYIQDFDSAQDAFVPEFK